MTRVQRDLLIVAIVVAAGAGGLLLLARHMREAMQRSDMPRVKTQLRSLAAGQAAHFKEQHRYAADVVRVWAPPAGNSAQGIQLRIIAADSSGYVAEGRSVGWEGRCVVAVGPFAGDSLPAGEVVCQGA